MVCVDSPYVCFDSANTCLIQERFKDICRTNIMGNSINARPPHTLGEKKLYGRVQQASIEKIAEFRCGTVNLEVLTGV